MYLLKQKIHWRSIFGQIGLLLHVPAIMALLALPICIFFHEWFALFPLIALFFSATAIGQFLYRYFFKKGQNHLWDAMLIAAIGWLFCSLLAAIPIWWISSVQIANGIHSEVLEIFSNPLNALFESFSGFTSTGLTMMTDRGYFPYILQFWRSLLEWVGGLGLIAFVLSLIHLNQEGYPLYYAEAHTEYLSRDTTKTAQWVWILYLLYTILGSVLFIIAGMPIWEAFNHAMTVISTGGFTVIRTNFSNYTIAIQLIALLMMIVGASSFAIHCYAIRDRKGKMFWTDIQQRLFYFFLVVGTALLLLFNYQPKKNLFFLDTLFEWSSALTTCGFTTMPLTNFTPMSRLFLIIGMIIGGSTGSTAGGIKIRRFIYLFSAIFLRIATITKKKEKLITKTPPKKEPLPKEEPPGTDLPHDKKSERLFTAEVLFSLWIITLVLGWLFMLNFVPKGRELDALFDVTSAMSNVGLSSGILHADFPSIGKGLFIFLMWVGRLEIIPALILFFTLPFTINTRR